MEFKLFYLGQVRSDDTSSGKHRIRKCFHNQLDRLWGLPPLKYHPAWQRRRSKLFRMIGQVPYTFLVGEKLDMYAELRIDVLFPEQKPSFKEDIDNKLKTLCDALSLPAQPPAHEERDMVGPFRCLLEDDHLIYKLAVDTEFLLASDVLALNRRQTMWIINVKIKGNRFDRTYKDLIV